MGKAKAVVKQSTVDRLIKLINKKYSNKEDLLKSKEYTNLTQFMNWFEKEHRDMIIDMCYNSNTFDEIKFVVEKGNTEMNNKKSKKAENNVKKVVGSEFDEREDMDPVEKEAMHFISKGKVEIVEVEPVTVTIGDDNIAEVTDQNEVVEEAINVDSVIDKKNNLVICLPEKITRETGKSIDFNMSSVDIDQDQNEAVKETVDVDSDVNIKVKHDKTNHEDINDKTPGECLNDAFAVASRTIDKLWGF